MDDWKTGSVPAVVRQRITSCQKYLDTGLIDSVRLYMTGLQWRRGLDLSDVPPEIVAQTDRLSADAGGLLVRASLSVEGAKAKLEQMLELW
jgi:hypothetical protein